MCRASVRRLGFFGTPSPLQDIAKVAVKLRHRAFGLNRALDRLPRAVIVSRRLLCYGEIVQQHGG
jgi:hypothetical protein